VTESRGRREELIPSAARLLNTMRDLGYEFTNAVADIIDNSISAGASLVEVTIEAAGADSYIRIVDNGGGMSAAVISESMRLGSGGRDYRADELGKFGLGLKTASLSQARSITVASRTNPDRKMFDVRVLDLDDVLRTDRWEIVHPAPGERPAAAIEPLQRGPGTVVLWNRLDRILNLTDPYGTRAESVLGKYAERLDQHLGMVFERFLSGTAERSRSIPLVLTINGRKVEAWDPFCLKERTEYLPEHTLKVAGGHVRYRPYVVPPQREFSSDEAWKRAGGPNQWNRQQGLYVYRADRLIQSGGWSWLRGTEEHIKLARAALEFWPALDEKFEINISKMRVKIPEDLRDQLRGLISLLARQAQERYRLASRNPKPPSPPPPVPKPPTRPTAQPRPVPDPPRERGPVRDPGSDGSADPATGLHDPGPEDGPGPLREQGTGEMRAEPARRAAALRRAAADAGVGAALDAIRQQLLTADPEAAHDLGW